MADVIRKATNKFTKGLVMDFSPENTKNELLTHALNATLLTFNGNELSLQNDMGNARVETAYLPEGYMPVGTCEYGGIIYIVSYNPLEDKSQIGCFPSPERNISSDEIGIPKAAIQLEDFQELKDGIPTGTIKHNTKHVLLKNDNLNPGDKFIVCANPDIYNERLEDLWVKEDSEFRLIDHPMIALNVVSIEDSGRIIYLNSDIRQYDKPIDDVTYKYHILGDMGQNGGVYDQSAVDIDAYRDVLSSGYSVFKSKTSGRLAILAELIMIDSYSVTHSIEPRLDEDNKAIEGAFDVVIHMDIEPKVTAENYTQVPKLQYYYLQNSQGYIQVANPSSDAVSGYIKISDNNYVKPLYYIDNGVLTDKINPDFGSTLLTSIKTSTDPSLKLDGTLGKTGKFNFPKPFSYHGRMVDYEGPVTDDSLINNKVYTKFTEGKYHRMKKSQVEENHTYYLEDVQAKFYKHMGGSGVYDEVPKDSELDDSYSYYIIEHTPEYIDAKRDETYKGQTLYKQVTFPEEAPDEILIDTSVEKWVEETKTFYTALSLEEANNTDRESLRVYVNGGYSDLIPDVLDPNAQYYKVESTTIWTSLGHIAVDRNKYPDKVICYYPSSLEFIDVFDEKELEAYWDLRTYDATDPYWGYKELFFYVIQHEEYKLATEEVKLNFKENPKDVTLYYRSDYQYIYPNQFDDYDATEEALHPLFMTVPMDTYVTADRFLPNTSYNYIDGYGKPEDSREPTDGFHNEGPIYLYTVADFIPDNLSDDDSSLKYDSLRLGNIKLPGVAVVHGFDIPFQYHYTVVPCMNYGKLDHLAVSNTVDFSKLHNFNQSNFTTWKYHIDGDQLRLTFGADIYDTYEQDKVDGLFLEFYDAWGFAGSLEITDRKAYSGVFTKVITLNSLGALNKTRVIGSQLYDTFKRNVNITESLDSNGMVIANSFKYKGNEVTLSGDSGGWNIPQDDNDCGTLYSNLVYGVKTYIRTTNKTTNSSTYIPKKEFFLYTLPIYNDYYYSVNDFSTITNPKLDLVLTYKLQDSGTRIAYNEGNIANGYNTQDSKTIAKYTAGTYNEKKTLDLVKYYKYSGTSDLYLEVGLKKEYEDYNLSYDPIINKNFSCTLQLLGEDSEDVPYSVQFPESRVLSKESALCYYRDMDNPIKLSINKLGFGKAPGDSRYDLSTTAHTESTMFINGSGKLPIPINYEFVVGYKANISNIEETDIQTTTVSALCHKGLDDEYNYSDFGIYQNDAGEFLSNAMFYNGGTSTTEKFGVCRQVSTDPSFHMAQQCRSYDYIETDANDSKLPRLLNAGEPLKQMKKHLGKLTFCQPHAHSVDEYTGVNMIDFNGDGALGITPDKTPTGDPDGKDEWNLDEFDDTSHGIVGKDYLQKNPLYNLSLNTKSSINTHSEFISTIYYSTTDDRLLIHKSKQGEGWTYINHTMLRYNGITSAELAKFNAALVQTMKSVYAYNPDYDSFTIMAGDAAVEDKQIQFSSNLVSSNAVLNLEGTFNDYIYIGSLKFSNYLNYMSNHSNVTDDTKCIKTHTSGKPLEQVQLTPGFDYCGPINSKYLITSLNYSTPAPDDLTAELEFKSSSNLMIKHENGEIEFLDGTPNKKALYGFDKELHKLIQLDVSNYKINTDGKLTLKSSTIQGEKSDSIDLTSVNLPYNNDISWNYSFPVDFTVDGETTTLNLNLEISIHSYVVASDKNKIYVCLPGAPGYGNTVTVRSYISIPSNNNYSYDVSITSLECDCNGKLLDPSKICISGSTGSRPNLNQQSAAVLSALASDTTSRVSLKGTTGSTINYYTSELHVGDGGYVYQNTETPNTKSYEFSTYSVNAIELYEFILRKINFTIKRYSAFKNNPNTIIKSTKTSNYYTLKNHVYEVNRDFSTTCLVGTSLTLNDLVYDGTSSEHRLFVRENCYSNDGNEYRNIIYYRDLEKSDWGTTNEHKNHLYLQTGPCFIPDNI